MFFQIEDLTYSHQGVSETTPPALKNISLKVEEGEWIALIGANGSGKTTLVRHLNALLLPSSGRVLVNGLETQNTKNLAQIRSAVGMVFQSPEDQIISSLVIEDTAFGPENLGIDSAQLKERVHRALDAVGMWEERMRSPHLLSAGQIQRVALAGVLAMQPRCIIFDETTAMLDPLGRREVLNQMSELHRQGITIIMITHSMDEAALAKRVILLEEGQVAYDGLPEKLFLDTPLLARCHLEPPTFVSLSRVLQKHFSGIAIGPVHLPDLLKQIPTNVHQVKSLPEFAHSTKTTRIIGVENLTHTYLAGTPLAQVSLKGVSLTTSSGLAHGLVGATGSGKSTLLQHLNGLYLPQSGRVRVGEYVLNDPKVDIRGLRRYAGLVFQNPESYFFEQYVGDEIAYGPKLLHGREGLRERVQRAMGWVGLDFERFKDRMTLTLSGGEKRKVALAAALAMEPGLLILDEPTAGLDPYSRRGLLTILKQLQSEGMQVVFSSHNMEDIAALVKEMTILAHGESLCSGPIGELFNDRGLIARAGLAAPAGADVATALREKGWPISMDVFSADGLDVALSGIERGQN